MIRDKALNKKTVKIKNVTNEYCSRKVLFFNCVSSTQIIARNLAKNNEPDRTVVIASTQFCGKGRMNREWESVPDHGLYFSMILRPKVDPTHISELSLLTAVALVNAIKNVSGLSVRIKWPNDIMYENKKICGILSESAFNSDKVEYVIIGIGINVNQKLADFSNAISKIASSISINVDKYIDLDTLFLAFLRCFDYWYDIWQQNGAHLIIPEWNKFNCTIGKKVNLYDDGKELCSGLAVAIDGAGNLIIKDTAQKIASFNYGEVSIHLE